MSEGLFKKRMKKVFADFDKESVDFLLQPFIDIVDEVHHDIFSAIHVEYGADTRRRDIDAIKLFAALDKWFGDEKK